MYSRSRQYLQFPVIPVEAPAVPAAATKLSARIGEIGSGRSDAILLNTNVSHTATVPMHSEVAEGIEVFDGTYTYLIVSFEEVLGRYRLRLERLR